MLGEREEAERKKEAPTEKTGSVAGEVSRRGCARGAVLVERGLAALQSYCRYIYWRTQKKDTMLIERGLAEEIDMQQRRQVQKRELEMKINFKWKKRHL